VKVKILKFASLKDLPELAGWLTFGEAADALGLTGERIRQMAQEGKLTTARRIGHRPVGIVRESEIQAMIRFREAEADARQSVAS
jgi:hypothetical protein